MNNLNSLLNHHHISSDPHFDPTPPHDEFLEQMLSSVPNPSASSFPWADDHPSQLFGDHSPAAKTMQHQITNAAAKALMLQQQLLFSRNQNDASDGPSFDSSHPANEASVEALFNGFADSIGQTPNQPQHFQQPQNFGIPATVSQPAGGGGGVVGRQKVRARRGQATDPHSIAERLRRERIAERMKGLQELVPNANKTDKASMLDEIIDYVKFLQLQVKVLSMSRLGGAAAVASLAAAEGRTGNGTQTASSSNNEGMTVTEHQVAKLMEDDMGSAMQYLQGKGLCLMPISLATAISTATSHSRTTPFNNPLINGDAGGPTSPSISALTIQSAAVGGGESSLKDPTSVYKR